MQVSFQSLIILCIEQKSLVCRDKIKYLLIFSLSPVDNNTASSNVRCDEDDSDRSLAIGLTFLFTFLLTALLAVIVGVIAVAVDRKRCQKHAPEQVPANNVTQNVYGTHE